MNPALQNLKAAAPAAGPKGPGGTSPDGAGGPDNSVLLKAAAHVLQQAVQQFGPQIVMVLKQILSSAGQGGDAGAPPAQASPFNQ